LISSSFFGGILKLIGMVVSPVSLFLELYRISCRLSSG
jgi:hypothetical protein